MRTLILTNAAGAVNPSFHPGELMLVTDHIKLTADRPARGKLPAVFGPMFPDMSQVYALRLRELALRCAREEGIALREGCYFYMPGPQYETPAEIRAVRSLGGDAVGMSTVAEAIAGAQGGMEVAAISCLTNMAAGHGDGAHFGTRGGPADSLFGGRTVSAVCCGGSSDHCRCRR